jgi:LCP family protein required for cell wall assembly
VALVGALPVLGLAAVAVGLDRRLDSVQRVEIGQDGGADPLDTGAPVTLLVLGTDGVRSDVILVLRVADGRVSTLSIPRDLWTGTGTERMNALSPAALTAWLAQNLGIEVDHLVSMDMVGFARLADRIEPRVRVELPMRDRHSGLSLDAGCQSLDGDHALAYVRARHLMDLPGDPTHAEPWRTDPTGDLGRIARTQSLLVAVWSQLNRLDPTDLPALVDLLVDQATLDSGLDTSELAQLARRIRSADSPPSTSTLPVHVSALGTGGSTFASVLSVQPGAAADEAVASVGGRLSPDAHTLPVSNLPGELREYPASAALGLVTPC